MKPTSTSFVLMMLGILVLASCTVTPENGGNAESASSSVLLGGDRDTHGCIPSAGYQWCEEKQKCLRIWEEPCTASGSAIDTSSWSTFQNAALGFSLQFPPAWEGYKATENTNAQPKFVGFSFSGDHRPFEIFKIMKFTKGQWEQLGTDPPFTVLTQSSDSILVCDGCCQEGGDTSGGGQFDLFQQERCGEVPRILRTFQREQ